MANRHNCLPPQTLYYFLFNFKQVNTNFLLVFFFVCVQISCLLIFYLFQFFLSICSKNSLKVHFLHRLLLNIFTFVRYLCHVLYMTSHHVVSCFESLKARFCGISKNNCILRPGLILKQVQLLYLFLIEIYLGKIENYRRCTRKGVQKWGKKHQGYGKMSVC